MMLTLVAATAAVFLIMRSIPGDAVSILVGLEGGTDEQLQRLRSLYGLDKPFYIQYGFWLWQVIRGNLGYSHITGRPVLEELLARLPVTLELTGLTLLVSVIVGTLTGVVLAVRHNTKLDLMGRVASLLGMSLPNFAFGIILILLVSNYAPGLYVLGYVGLERGLAANLKSLLLPTVALSVPLVAVVSRITRSSVLEVLRQEYVTVARAKGLHESAVVLRHVLKNSLIPVITVTSFQVGYLLGGAVVVEQVFSLPGLARATFTAISQRDYPLLQGVVLFMAVSYVLINFVTDVLYLYVDPRVKYQ